MKPATEQQKAQVFFMEAREQAQLNISQTDPKIQEAFLNPETDKQSDYAQNTTAFD